MANATYHKGFMLSVLLDGATDWDLTTDWPDRVAEGLSVRRIEWFPTAADDEITIRNSATATTSATIVFKDIADSVYSNNSKTFDRNGMGQEMWPCINASEVTSNGTVVIFEFD